MKLPEGDFDAYIFDCDGTLADTMPLHYKAWTQALAVYGATFPEELFYEFGGIPTVRIVELLNERFGYTMPPAQAAAEKEELFITLIPQTQPITTIVEIARRFHGVKPMAVASGGHRAIVQRTLEALGILSWFDAIIGSEDYLHGKPAPDPYLQAAARLGVDPKRCLAFEDTQTGVASAAAAGMATVLVPRQ